jgi:hypothetical protein
MLAQLLEKKEAGEFVGGDAPAAASVADEPAATAEEE